MILDLKHFESFPARIVLTDETVRTDIGTETVQAVKSLNLELNIQKSDDEYFCQGRLEATAELECARCLKPFERKLESELDFIVAAAGSDKASEENVIDDEDYAYYDYELRADLWEILRQAVILAVDMKPLCVENCRGFCSVCGGNLNDVQCNCRKENSKNQFAELRDLR
jgi:uncharacterized protein